jgi:hypothetical protein
MYQPNFKDPRTIRRLRTALGFTRGVLSATKPHQWPSRYLDKYLGGRGNQLAVYLRSLLLITTDDFYSKDGQICKEYLLNTTGYSYLKARLIGEVTCSYQEFMVRLPSASNNRSEKLISINTHVSYKSDEIDLYDYELVKELFMREYGEQFSATEFNYNDKSGRLWHPIQNIRSEIRKRLMAEQGYVHTYDISCCAPTLILRHAQELGEDEWLPAIQQYISDKHAVRAMLCRDLEIPVATAKLLVNALFCGARLANNRRQALAVALGDSARVIAAQEHPFLLQLRADIKRCWSMIEPTMTVIRNTATGRKVPLNSKRKWARYFDLERRVLNSIRAYLKQTGNDCFLEHDGWSCKQEVDIDALVDWIYRDTGYWVRIE